jgi:Uma2 family endonuclease
MSAALKWNLISVDDYLAGELESPIKHEYVAGVVYAMAGARNTHNEIGGNAFASLHLRLRGRECRPCNSDTKIRLRLGTQIRFYYPDTSVTCRPNAGDDSFQDEPVVLFEVLSRGTRRTDLGEKKDAYLAVPSLKVYVVIEQDSPTVVAFRRTDAGFVQELYAGLDAVLPLPEIDTELPLAEIYERVEFIPEPSDDDQA